jgi:undecaprenyl-diphosphatase
VNPFFAVLLGLVQGVSEWLPISSKTQVLFASTFLFSLPLAVAYAFGLFMEIGSLGSAIAYFRKDLWFLFNDRKLLVYLLIVTAFTAIVGVPLYYLTDKVLASNPYNVGIPMILLGLVLIGTGFYIRYSRVKPRLVAGLEEMKLKNYVIVGIAQGIAALPGVSRSGMTVSTMLLMGVKPEQAFRLSYLAYIPASLGAFFVTLLLSRSQVDTAIQTVEPTGVLIAILTAAIVGVFVISYLLKFAKRSRIYMIDLALGSVALVVGIVATILAPQSPSIG